MENQVPLTPYQAQKIRDLVSVVNRHMANQYPKNTDYVNKLLQLGKQAVPYKNITDPVLEYLKTPDPEKETYYLMWELHENPETLEILLFHTLQLGIRLEKRPVTTGVEDWVVISETLMEYVDGPQWQTYLSDTDRTRELIPCFSLEQLASLLDTNINVIEKVCDGNSYVDINHTTKIKCLHTLYEEGMYTFGIEAMVSLWFETEDVITGLTPAELVKRDQVDAVGVLSAKLKTQRPSEY